MRRQISINTYVNQIPIKTNKRSDHIVIKHINTQSLIPKLDEIKLLIENEDLSRVPLAFISILPGIHANHTEKWGVPLVMYGG